MSSKPVVAIIIPAFNAGGTLSQTLDSVLAQTFDDWVAVVVDDGSSDTTASIAREYALRCAKIRCVQQSNAGISAARNTGMAACPAEYFAFLDADDVWLPDKLERQVAAAREHDADFVDCAFWTFEHARPEAPKAEPPGPRGQLDAAAFLLALARGCAIRPSCVMLASWLVREMGGFDETLRAAEDTDYWMRATRLNPRFYRMPERLCLYRVMPTSHSHDYALGFWSHMQVLPRHLTPDRVSARERVQPIRLWFRNAFTLEGDRRRFHQLDAMFAAYHAHDAEGWACQVMAWLRRFLPLRIFWWVSRYAVIPLAWQLERRFAA